MRLNKKLDKKGFTILELMIASSIFSVILLLCTFGLIQIGKTYYKGANTSRTQAVARDVVDRLSQGIQYGSTAPSDSTGAPIPGSITTAGLNGGGAFCIGTNRYTYQKNKRVGEANADHALVVDTVTSGCAYNASNSFDAPIANKGKELLGKGMRLMQFDLAKSGDSYTIAIRVTQGDDDLIRPDGNCNSGAGSQFCASSYLTTVVNRRLNN